jgi:hypothetical protein
VKHSILFALALLLAAAQTDNAFFDRGFKP